MDEVASAVTGRRPSERGDGFGHTDAACRPLGLLMLGRGTIQNLHPVLEFTTELFKLPLGDGGSGNNTHCLLDKSFVYTVHVLEIERKGQSSVGSVE